MIEDDCLPDDWTTEQLRLFGEIKALASTNQHLFAHPKAARVSDEHWLTLCHNFAYCAAIVSNGDDFTVHDMDTDEVLMTTEKGTLQ